MRINSITPAFAGGFDRYSIVLSADICFMAEQRHLEAVLLPGRDLDSRAGYSY